MSASTVMLRLSILLLAAGPLACTYGEVEWGGDSVVGADVRFESCNGDIWSTQTNSSGRYVFDGHANDDEAIPEGPYLVRVDLPGYSAYRLEHVDHVFTSCPDGSGKLCDQHDVDFGWRPLSGWEWSVWLQNLSNHNAVTYHTFHNEICVWTQQ